MLYFKWQEIKENTFSSLSQSSLVIKNSTHSVLKHQETSLTILGNRLIEQGGLHGSISAKNQLIHAAKQNPDLVGFGLANLDGDLVTTSFNVPRAKLPNLLAKPETSRSFRQALKSPAMVLGRTYFLPAAGQWVIPARYRITDDIGNLRAVMTTGFVIDTPNSPWNARNLPASSRLIVARKENGKYYRLYMSGIPKDAYGQWLDKPVDENIIKQLSGSIYNRYGIELDQIETFNRSFVAEGTASSGNSVIVSIIYDKTYQTYSALFSPVASLYPKMIKPSFWLLALLLIFNTVMFFLFRQIQIIQNRSKESLTHQANHDPLTDLPNRNYLNRISHSWLSHDTREFSFLFMDLNNFKSANDAHGHRVGDEILKIVAERIQTLFKGDTAIRLGGDEFIVLLINKNAEQAKTLAKAFLTELRKAINIHDLEFSISASVGISHYPNDADAMDELLRKADIAMYDAKRNNRNITIFSNQLDDKQKKTAQIERALSTALDKNEFFLVYQPQIDADSGELLGVETLIRWESETLGFVPPDQFIPLAESNGLINEIGLFVMQKAMRDISELWHRIIGTELQQKFMQDKLRLSINMSVQQLLHTDFVANLDRCCTQYNCDDLVVAMEITESLFIDDLEKARDILLQLNDMGILISLDDFGTGYSSLSILSLLPIDELKIDKSFIQHIETDDQALSLIQSIISLGKSLQIPVLAEGVEEASQAAILAVNGCDSFQGYLYAKPLSIDQLEQFIIDFHLNPNAQSL